LLHPKVRTAFTIALSIEVPVEKCIGLPQLVHAEGLLEETPQFLQSNQDNGNEVP